MFLPSGDRYLGGLPKLHKRCQIHFCLSRGNLVFLSRHYSEKGLSSRVEGKPLVLLELQWKLGVPLELRQDLTDLLVLPPRSQVSFCVRAKPWIPLQLPLGIGPCLESVGQLSVPVQQRQDLGFLSQGSTRESGPVWCRGMPAFLELSKGCQASCRVQAGNLAYKRISRGVRPPIML